MEWKDRPRKTKEQLQKEIIGYLSQEVKAYSGDLNVAGSWGIRRKTGNEYAGPEFSVALMDLVNRGIVEVVPTTGLTGDDWYRLAKGVA